MFDRTTHCVDLWLFCHFLPWTLLKYCQFTQPSGEQRWRIFMNIQVWYQTEHRGWFCPCHFREVVLNFITKGGTTACLYRLFLTISSSTAFYVNERELYTSRVHIFSIFSISSCFLLVKLETKRFMLILKWVLHIFKGSRGEAKGPVMCTVQLLTWLYTEGAIGEGLQLHLIQKPQCLNVINTVA